MSTDLGLGLGLSIVDNPIAAGGRDALGAGSQEEEEELVVLPEQLQRIGALLSTPEGKPTALYRLLHGAVLASCAMFCFSGWLPFWGMGRKPVYSLPLADALQGSAFSGGTQLGRAAT